MAHIHERYQYVWKDSSWKILTTTTIIVRRNFFQKTIFAVCIHTNKKDDEDAMAIDELPT